MVIESSAVKLDKGTKFDGTGKIGTILMIEEGQENLELDPKGGLGKSITAPPIVEDKEEISPRSPRDPAQVL